MNKQQKIKIIIKMSILILLITISCVFYKPIDKFFINVFNSKFKVVFKEDNLMVHFINVGQGDAVAINLPNGEVMLIDVGPLDSNVTLSNYFKEKVLNTSKNDSIDYLILTHADEDHCMGTQKVLNEFDVKKVFIPIVDGKENYKNLKNFVVNNYNYEVLSRELNLSIGNCKIEVFGLYEYADTNESSAIIKITYLSKSFLFMADVSSKIETRLLDEYGSKLDCDVLKVAHHGSKNSTCLKFLETATPDYSIISVGQNSYGHPTQIVLNNLQAINSEILRTDLNGNILFTLGKNYNLVCNYGNFVISGFIVDYRIFVLVVDACLIYFIIKITLKKPKNKHITN